MVFYGVYPDVAGLFARKPGTAIYPTEFISSIKSW